MRLYLSSYRLGIGYSRLPLLIGPAKNAAIIGNALDYLTDKVRKEYETNVYDPKQEFAALGIRAVNLDLREYFMNPAKLLEDLKNFNLIWVLGGNVFLLRRAMKQSGFDKVIIKMLESDKLVYGGFSAGAVIVAPTLRGIDLMDDPLVLADGYNPEIIWDGLNLTDFTIVPHYQSEHPETKLAEKAVDFFKENDYPFYALHDGEVIIKNGTNFDLMEI
jgi:dipeptidase E